MDAFPISGSGTVKVPCRRGLLVTIDNLERLFKEILNPRNSTAYGCS